MKRVTEQTTGLAAAAAGVPGVVAVLASLAVPAAVLFGRSGPASPATVLWGMALMLAAGAAVATRMHPQDRRFTTGQEGNEEEGP